MKKYQNMSESGIVTRDGGELSKIIVNSHSSGTLTIYDAVEAGAQATTTLTSAGACVPASHGQNVLTSSGAMVAGTHAVSVFTSSGAVVEDETITIGSTVYTAKAIPTAPYHVAMGANAEAFLANLKNAINGTLSYGGTEAHPSVVATASDATTLTVRGRVPGTSLNTVATTETFTNGSWADSTFGGGTGDSNPAVTSDAATFTIGDITYTAVLELSETSGATAVPYQILWVTSEAVFLDNIKKAVNASGLAGTDYSTGTYEHPQVYATTNTNTTQVFLSKTTGTGGNSIATTETLGNYSFTSTVMASGTGSDGRIMHSTITLSAVATTGERTVEFGGEEFVNGLYITVGGTADFTVVYN